MDDGWQTLEGDWDLVKTKFPNGDADMRGLVDKIHAQGFKAQLWWAPLAAKPESDLAKNHPEDAAAERRRLEAEDLLLERLVSLPGRQGGHRIPSPTGDQDVRDWGYDGLKLDGQHMNAVPPCYNPAHKHARPEESVEDLPKFFQMIYDTARSIKPDALVELCPCGTAFNFYTLPNLNMSVASDPQTRGRSAPRARHSRRCTATRWPTSAITWN